jgi:hypothetical protein
MTETGRYIEETAHLTETQKRLYGYLEEALLSVSQTDEGFINSLFAVEALAKTMRMSHDNWKKKFH